MRISEIFNIEKNSVISIVGAGGKTSLMFTLARELREQGRVLVTTTTKIYYPKEKHYDFLILGKGQDNCSWGGIRNFEKGIWIYGKDINEEGKLRAIDEKLLTDLNKYFDYVLIEADGAKEKPLKGWREDEPIVSPLTTMTIGIIDIETLGIKICEDNIHRVGKFLGRSQGIIEARDLMEVIFNPKGLFNHSQGKRILYINKVDDEKISEMKSEFIKEVVHRNRYVNMLDEIIYGSLKSEYCRKMKGI